MTKKIAIYGVYETLVPVYQRYWKRRRDGWKQRYWKRKHGCYKRVVMEGRYEFQGKGKDLYRAVIQAHHYMPKGFVDITVEEFLEHPEQYGFEGEWIEKGIES